MTLSWSNEAFIPSRDILVSIIWPFTHQEIFLKTYISSKKTSTSNIGLCFYSYWLIVDLDLCSNTIKYRNRHKHRDEIGITLHFINIKYWKMLTDNGKQTSSGNGSLSLRRDVVATCIWIVLQWGSKAYLLLRNNGKP